MSTQDQDALRWQLQGLRRDVSPQADLWPGIAARIASTPPQQAVATAPPVNRRRFAPWAMAASVLLAVGFIWQLTPDPNQGAAAPADPLIRKQAVSMTFEYEKALARMGQTDSAPEMHAALGDLDRSAQMILTAIDDNPEARFLLDQLRRTYARRLQLTQRTLMT